MTPARLQEIVAAHEAIEDAIAGSNAERARMHHDPLAEHQIPLGHRHRGELLDQLRWLSALDPWRHNVGHGEPSRVCRFCGCYPELPHPPGCPAPALVALRLMAWPPGR